MIHLLVGESYVQMLGNKHSIRFFLPVSVFLTLPTAGVARAGQPAEGYPHLVEVFTTTELPISSEAALDAKAGFREIEIHLYELDGMQRIEAKLSKDLLADPEQSKRIVLQRMQHLDGAGRSQMQRTAVGLAKAMQYGVNRYPVLIFDGEIAIYGVTDIREALHRYRQWRVGGKQ